MPITISGSGTMGTMASGGITGGATITSGTAVVSTSGTSIDFTGIPSWAKRVTVMFNGVSTNGTNPLLVQIGSGSVQTTGYTSAGSDIGSAVSTTVSTTGFRISSNSATSVLYVGALTINNFGSNIWVANVASYRGDSATNTLSTGNVTLSGALDRVRITTVGSTDTFDAGSVNILYE